MSLSEKEVRRLMESDAYTNKNNKNYERVNREVRQGFENLYPDDDRNENPENYYVWRTQGDDRVRGKHAERENEVFCWDEPPEGGHPGEDYNCRCWAEPYIPPKKEKDGTGTADIGEYMSFSDKALAAMSGLFGISEAKAKEPEIDAVTYASGSEMDKAVSATKRAAPDAFERYLSRQNLLEPSRKIPPVPVKKPEYNKNKITFDDVYYSKYDENGKLVYKNTDKHEGSFSNRGNDLGGKTNYGVTQFSLDEYHNWKSNKKTMHNLPKVVRQLSSEQAKNILDEMYYQKYELNKINNITILRNVFDEEVNQGTNVGIDLADIVNSFKGKSLPRSKIVSQELANIVNELNHNDTMKVNNLLAERRMDRYFDSVDRYPTQNINNLRGWYNRAKSYHTNPKYFEKLYKNKVDFYIQKKYPHYYNGR